MSSKTTTLAAVLAATLLAGAARADDTPTAPAPAQERIGEQSRERQQLRDGSGAGGQAGRQRGACDGTMRRDRLRDGSGAGAAGRRGGMGGGRH